MKTNPADILAVLKGIDHAETPCQALERFQDFVGQFGIDRYLVSQMVNPLRPEAKHAMRFTNFPEELIQSRFTSEQLLHDPVVQYGIRSRFPFSWQQAYDYAGRYGRQLMLGARDFGLYDGFMFPMRQPGRPDGGVSLSAKQMSGVDATTAWNFSAITVAGE